MRIAIDYTAAVWQGAGIGRYTRELVRAVIEQGPEHEYRLFYAAYGLDSSSPLLAGLQEIGTQRRNVRLLPIPLPPRRLAQIWHRLRIPLPIELVTGPIDLLHATDFVPPPTAAAIPVIVTVHDLSYIVHPECALPSVARYLNGAVPRGVRRANALLADSIATKRDLEQFMQVDPQRVTVVYPGVRPEFRPMTPSETEPFVQTMGLPERFLLFVSTIEPRKNLPRLLEAYAQVRERIGNLPLVIAGRKGWMYDEFFQAIGRLGLTTHVQLLDYVDDKALPSLYNRAWAFVYPSIYEGFGFPALEALACGTPVLTADNSSLPEVVGDLAVLVRAEDVSSIAAGLERIVCDEALRERLRAGGPQRAHAFTWSHAASQVLALYRELGRSAA
jgi:glycosyltransferase involved in cell wall biosynthesis